MIESVEVREPVGLDDYGEVIHLAEAVRRLRGAAPEPVSRLRGRKVWMVNSTARGGGVAEMMPKLVSLLRELGVDVEWVVMGSREPRFFELTKRLHNLIHGQGDPGLGPDDHALYAAVSSENAAALKERLGPRDVLVVHDPQPLGMGALVKRETGNPFIFRCHIGLDAETVETRAAWGFLQPWAEACDRAVFTAREYVPEFLADRSVLITPAIDPLSYKNRELSPHKLVGILKSAGLARSRHPVVPARFPQRARRLGPDGEFHAMDEESDIGIPFRPIVTQVSRWDRLKGYVPLLDAFAYLKHTVGRRAMNERHRRRLAHVRLVMAGPDPEAVADDPEARDVLLELASRYRDLPHWLQEEVAIVSLPMHSRENNALMVNALQRCSSVVVQNSLREGFGLTVTEAMWKQCAILGSRACGVRLQVRDGVDGHLVADSQNHRALADLLDATLEDLPGDARTGRSAQRRVHDEFLVFTQVRRWLETLAGVLPDPV
jgi:trehalose synthase